MRFMMVTCQSCELSSSGPALYYCSEDGGQVVPEPNQQPREHCDNARRQSYSNLGCTRGRVAISCA